LTDISQFRTVSAWRAALGLLPVPLRDAPGNQERYVLLNGSTGNFCLDFVGGVDRTSRSSAAWSCDVGHYVTCVEDSIIVNRWDTQGTEESYSRRSVIAQLHEFHRHLEKTSPDRSRSVVAHVLRIFRQIRAAVQEEAEGLRSLRILLHLLASAATEQYRLVEGDLGVWGLTPEILDSSRDIPDATWLPLYNDLSGLGRYQVVRPDFELVLRHASGAVFQDAHLEVQISPTYWLPGFERPGIVDAKAIPNEAGIYFTPPALARTLAEEATRGIQGVGDRELVLFDPACGSAELLKECLRLLRLQQYPGRIHLLGWDKSAASVDMARFVLAWEKRAWPADRIQVEVVQQDSLLAPRWPDAVDILVMNPPFRSWALMTHDEQEAITKLLGASYKPNLAMAFASRAVGSLRGAGTLAMITPNSLLEAASGASLRETLGGSLVPQLIARLGDQNIFARALVDAGLYVGKRKPVPDTPAAILWADSRPNSLSRALRGLRKWRGAEAEPLLEEGFSVYQREDIGKTRAPWIARGYEAWTTYQNMERTKRTMPAKKMFDIKQGVRLGNDVFVVAKDFLQKLRKNERRFFRPAVMNLSIADGRLNDNYYVFYPYSQGLPPITSEQDLEGHVPTYFKALLLPAKQNLASRKGVKKDNLNWWELLRHRSWQEEHAPKLVSKYFGGIRSFAFDSKGEFVVVVGNAWLLEKGAVRLSITDVEIYLAILGYLNTEIAADLLEYVSIQVSGGQWDLSNKYVSALPIPNLSKLEAADIAKLVQLGTRISQGTIERWADANEIVLSILNR
jgi:adenine-specific DNA-methyltransferase